MLADQILYNGLGYNHSLPDILERELGIREYESSKKKFYQKSFIGLSPTATLSSEQLRYAADDTRHLHELFEVQWRKIKELGLEDIIRLESKLLPVLCKMEVTGCRIDVDGWINMIENIWVPKRNQIVDLLDDEVEQLSETYPQIFKKYLRKRVRQKIEILDLFGDHKSEVIETSGCINYASAAQILDLFKLCGQPLPMALNDKGELRPTAGENALQVYLTENPRSPMSKFVELLLKFREYEKLMSTYGYKFLDKLDSNNYIHTTYSQCYTETGRLSSRGPNLQNIPSTSLDKDGYDIRMFFTADPDDVMLTSDMEGAEVRIAADYSRERLLINSLLKGEDMHSKLASVSFSIICGQPVEISKKGELEINGTTFKKEELRNKHKSVLFAKFYKGGAKRCYDVLSEYINIAHSEGRMEIANQISKAIDKKLPKLSKFLSKQIREAQKNGWLRGSKLGRIRYFDKETVYGEAANFPIQNSNAEALKIAMIKVDEYFERTGYGRLVMNVHDEIVCSVKRAHIEEVSEFVKTTMADSLAYFLGVVPGGASVNIGNFWKK